MKKRFFRSITVLFLIAVITTPLFAKGQTENTSNEDSKTIKIFAFQFRNDDNRTQHMADAYMEIHPDVKIEIEEYPWDSYFQNLEVRFNAENPDLDVIIMDIPMIANYAERGFLKDLSQTIPESKFKDKIAPNSLADVYYNNQIVASPMQNSDQYLFINTDMAKEAGIELPSVVVDNDTKITGDFAKKWGDAAWTWEQVVDAAKKMTKDIDNDGIIDIYGLHIEQAGRLYQLQPLGGSKGGSIVAPDGMSVKGYLDQDPWYEAVKFYGDLFNKDKIEVPGSFIPGYDAPKEFVNGSYAMMVGGGWNIKMIMENPNINVAIAAHPYFEGGKATTPTGSWVIGASSSVSDEKMNLVSDFISWWTLTDEGSELWYDTNGELPASKYMLNKLSTDDKYGTFPVSAHRLGVYQVLNTAQGRPVTPFYPFINEGFDKAFINAAQGVNPIKALNDSIEEIEKNIQRVK